MRQWGGSIFRGAHEVMYGTAQPSAVFYSVAENLDYRGLKRHSHHAVDRAVHAGVPESFILPLRQRRMTSAITMAVAANIKPPGDR